VVLEKDGKDQLGRSYEKLRSVTQIQERVNILQTIKIRRDIWMGHILNRSCLQEHVIEGKIDGRVEVTGRQGKRCKKLLYDI